MMRRAPGLTILLGCVALQVPLPAIGQPAATSGTRFDGQWAVTLVCQAASDGAAGYIFHFPAEIKNGVLHGENGTRD
jgi:hypothetical protein